MKIKATKDTNPSLGTTKYTVETTTGGSTVKTILGLGEVRELRVFFDYLYSQLPDNIEVVTHA